MITKYERIAKASGFTGIRVRVMEDDGETTIRTTTCAGAATPAEAKLMIQGLGKTTYANPVSPEYPNSTFIQYGIIEDGDTTAVAKTVTLADKVAAIIAARAKTPQETVEKKLNAKVK